MKTFFQFSKPSSHANLEKGPSHPPKGTFAPIGLHRKLKRLDQDASGASRSGKLASDPVPFSPLTTTTTEDRHARVARRQKDDWSFVNFVSVLFFQRVIGDDYRPGIFS